MPGFVGRTDELKRLEREMLDPDTRRITSILGLGGIGKSRLALELAYQLKLKHSQYSIFWIQAAQQLTFEKDVLDIGKKLRIAGIEEDKADIKNLVKQWLSNPSAGKWLIILDNADDEALWGKPSDSTRQELSLVEHLPRTTNGSILVTTRTRGIATYLAGKEVINLGALSSDDAVEMLRNGLETPDLAADRPTILTLVDKLAYLPLAIVQAASFINMTQRPVQTYVELLDKSEVDVIKLLSKDFGDPSRYANAKNPVATTWFISFNHIRTRHPLAAIFLSSMACFHEKNIPRSLLPEAGSDVDIIDAVAVLMGYLFVRRQAGSSSMTDSEEFYDIHRLVQLAARNWLKMEGSLTDYTKTCITRIGQLFPTRDHKHKRTWTAYCRMPGVFVKMERSKIGLSGTGYLRGWVGVLLSMGSTMKL